MATLRNNISSFFKKALILAVVLLLLFFLVDNVIMPQYVQQGKTTKVPDVTGMPLDEALRILQESGLEGKKSEERPDKHYPEGTVALQTPPAGAEVKFGRGVYLVVSGGEPMVFVPGLRGRSVRDASFALERFGLQLGSIQYEVSTEFPVNTIMDQAIPESTRVSVGTQVNVVASQGPSKDQVPVPSLLRKTLTEGEKILTQSGFKVGNITYEPHPEILPNTIIDQYPRAGDMASAGQPIDLVVTRRGELRQRFEN
jgi:beta-lactam-binding protein with PASTA domain